MKNTLILRTSTIGHEISKNKGLLEWFLKNKKKKINGFKNAQFSGPTSLEIAKILYKYVIKKNILKRGIYNISSKPISKYDLLMLLKKIYNKKVIINKNIKFKKNRTLNCTKFIKKTNYKNKSWPKLILENKKFYEDKFF